VVAGRLRVPAAAGAVHDDDAPLQQRLAARGMQRFSSFVADWSDDEVNQLAELLEKFSASFPPSATLHCAHSACPMCGR
jgi:hypothetical protein